MVSGENPRCGGQSPPVSHGSLDREGAGGRRRNDPVELRSRAVKPRLETGTEPFSR